MVYSSFIHSPFSMLTEPGFCLWRQCAQHSLFSQFPWWLGLIIWPGSGQWDVRGSPWWGLCFWNKTGPVDVAIFVFLLPWPGRWRLELWQPSCHHEAAMWGHQRTPEKKKPSPWRCGWEACAMPAAVHLQTSCRQMNLTYQCLSHSSQVLCNLQQRAIFPETMGNCF